MLSLVEVKTEIRLADAVFVVVVVVVVDEDDVVVAF